MTQAISFLNFKGGIGKTTLVTNLATFFAQLQSKKILVVDFDPQCNASAALLGGLEGYERKRRGKKPLSAILTEIHSTIGPVRSQAPAPVAFDDIRCNVCTYENGGLIDLLPADFNLSYPLERPAGPNIEDRLSQFLQGPRNMYDYVLIDGSPGYSVLTVNILNASDFVLIPVKPDNFSLQGLNLFKQKLQKHNQKVPPDDKVGILGVVVTMASTVGGRVIGFEQQVVEKIRNDFGGDVFNTEIHNSKSYSVGLYEGKSILEASYTRSSARLNFLEFAHEFSDRLRQKTTPQR